MAPIEEVLPDFLPGRFEFSSPIGSGIHAQVSKAWDRQLRRDVALKLMLDPTALDIERIETMGISASIRETVAKLAGLESRYTPLREARLLAMVDHPNIVPVLEVGRLEGCMIAVVMPYLDKGTLARREFKGAWTEVLETALQIGWGLAALHDAGILHRDLKPENILFGRDGRPRIADLGLACMTHDAEALAERVGTRAYMAPDVITRGFKDGRDDLYAYCMIVYEMFNDRSPFATMADREHGRVSPSTRLGMPPELHEILVRGLAPDAEGRCPGMKPLLRAMDRVRQPVPTPVPRPRRWTWVASAAALAAGVAIGIFIDEHTAKADECAEVVDELALVWNDSVQQELRGAFGTRKAGDSLDEWGTRWLAVRAHECAAARDAGQPTDATPCSASTRDRFHATVHAFRSPLLRRGLQFASVIAELPGPEYCLDHPDDADWGYGGLLELTNIDVEVDALARAGALDLAHARQADYMKLALEHGSELGIARATYFRAEIHRLEGRLDEAAAEFELALRGSIEIGVPVFSADCLLKLTAIAGERGELQAVDTHALMARELFARYRSERVAELLQVQGLALVSGSDRERERGVALLLQAMEMREEQLRQQVGSREWLSQARENYARGLLAVGRASEAIEYLDLALKMHQEEFGHGTWRTRAILMQKFSALLELRRFDDTWPVRRTILKIDADAKYWRRYAEDVWWMARGYENAGERRGAVFVLRAGRDMAIQHGSEAEIDQFELAIDNLDGR